MERWLPVKGFSNYEVSSNGKIRNVKTGRILKTTINDRGYEQVCLHEKNVQSAKRVHRLVADAFFDGDHTGRDVNHIDGNKTNNFIGNLEWCSRKENIAHAYQTGLKEEPTRVKVRVVETGVIYDSLSDCSKALGADRCQIHRCLTGKEKTCKGYHFENVG